MIKNHIKIAFRNIWKNKVFSLINIVGLSIGISAAFVIGAMVYFDLTFDKFHGHSERIYRITTDFSTPEGNFHNRGVAIPLGVHAKENMTGLETVSSFFTEFFFEVRNEDTDQIYENIEDAILADPSYFELFAYTWLAGSHETLLEPNKLVLTKSRATKYFPDTPISQIIGRSLLYNETIPLTITGIVADPNERTDLYFKEFVSLGTARNTDMQSRAYSDEWNNTNSATQVFVKVLPNVSLTDIQKQLDVAALEHTDKAMSAYGQKRSFYLQPLADIHFNADYGVFDNSEYQASPTVLSSLAFVALFLLLLGCINFINLNTAQAIKRAKEIGIRKTLGGSKKQLVFQFLSETFLLTFFAGMLSLFFANLLFRIFSESLPKGVDFGLFANPAILVFMALLLLTVTLLSGLYPALVLSRYRPVSVLKNHITVGHDKLPLRKYLTVFQFVIAQVFIIATILIGKQIHFLMTRDMGFEIDTTAFIRTWRDPSVEKRLRFIKEMEELPHIQVISLGGNPPASNSTISNMITYNDGQKEIHTSLQLLYGDLDYLDVYDIELLAGRGRLNDTIREYIINETCAKVLGFKDPQDAIDKMLVMDDGRIPIVGVMKDFNQRSLKTKIEPMGLIGDWHRSQFNTVHFSLHPQDSRNWSKTIAEVENVWKGIYPDTDFQLNFLNETVRQFYEQERRTSFLLKWATGLAILISCLGLLGLVTHTTERRIKEIGIRKVLGASLAQLNLLLCREFLILVGIAFIISTPIAWWGLDRWLQDFAYKTTLSWWVFLGSGAAMLLIALTIISFKTITAANTNPVKSLRTE